MKNKKGLSERTIVTILVWILIFIAGSSAIYFLINRLTGG